MICLKYCPQGTLCEIPKHMQVYYFLLKFLEQNNGKLTSDLLRKIISNRIETLYEL